jgi:hypothetical protein
MPIKKLPKISIIILNCNGGKFLNNCLKSVFATNYPDFEVILVDNGSTDGSPQLALRQFASPKNLQVILNEKNLGFAGGNNQGATKAKGDWLLFLNNDTEVEKNWLRNLIDEVLKDKKVAAAGCKQRSLVKRTHLDAVGGYLDRFGWSQKTGYKEKDKGQYDKVCEIFYGQGSSLLVKADIFKKIGGFDESYIIYYEEVDLCWRIHLASFKIIFVPRALIYHFGGGWQKKQPASSFFYLMRRNHLTTLIKNYSLANLAWILPLILFFYLASVIVLFFQGQNERAGSYLRAIGYNIQNLKSIFIKRKQIQKIRKISDSQLNYLFLPGVLFFQQFLGKD